MKRSIIGITLTAGLLATAAGTSALAANGQQTQESNPLQIQDSAQPHTEARAILFRGRERATNRVQESAQYRYEADVSGMNGGANQVARPAPSVD